MNYYLLTHDHPPLIIYEEKAWQTCKRDVTGSDMRAESQGEARVLKPEIELDQMYNPSADVADKEAKLAELEAPCHQPAIRIRLTRPSDIPVCLPAGSPAHRRSYPVWRTGQP